MPCTHFMHRLVAYFDELEDFSSKMTTMPVGYIIIDECHGVNYSEFSFHRLNYIRSRRPYAFINPN